MSRRPDPDSIVNLEKDVDGFDSFFALIHGPSPRKKRACLRCGTVFLSAGHGNRFCGSCSSRNANAATLAAEAY